MCGLRSAPRGRQYHFAKTLQGLSFHRLQSYPNVYVHLATTVILLAYVDEIMCCVPSEALDKKLKLLEK